MPADDGSGAAESDNFLAYVTTEFPDTAPHWVGYDSESDFLDIIGESDYGRDPTDDRPAFSAGIVFTSGSPDWAYTVSTGNALSGGYAWFFAFPVSRVFPTVCGGRSIWPASEGDCVNTTWRGKDGAGIWCTQYELENNKLEV